MYTSLTSSERPLNNWDLLAPQSPCTRSLSAITFTAIRTENASHKLAVYFCCFPPLPLLPLQQTSCRKQSISSRPYNSPTCYPPLLLSLPTSMQIGVGHANRLPQYTSSYRRSYPSQIRSRSPKSTPTNSKISHDPTMLEPCPHL